MGVSLSDTVRKKMKKNIKNFVITISLLSLFGCATTSNTPSTT